MYIFVYSMLHKIVIIQLKSDNRLFFPVVIQCVFCSEETKLYSFIQTILGLEK
jgi:hypothetical protein